jgi:hypothetical protein
MSKYFLLVFLIAQLFFCSCNGQNKKIEWKETIGTLPFHGHGGQGEISYEVNGKTYKQFFDHRNDEAKKDDKYTMRYNVNKPEEIEVDYWNPVFIKGEITSVLAGRITKLEKKSIWNGAPFVVFTYFVNNTTLEKYQYLPPDYKEKYPNLSVGQKYEVESWDEDVTRVALHLNKPITAR